MDLPESLLETQVHEPDCLSSRAHWLLAMNTTEDLLVLPKSVFVRVSDDPPHYYSSLQFAEGSCRIQVENQSHICQLLCHRGSFNQQDIHNNI